MPPIPTDDLRALRNSLDLAAAGHQEDACRAVEKLEPTVCWVADEHLIGGPPVSSVLTELVDLVMAYDETNDRTRESALYNDIADSILTYARLTKPGEPAQNSRCYCGSGKKYKQCHGAGSHGKAAKAPL